MSGLVLTTFDWVPDFPRGFVRDIRIRWALEEAGLPYAVRPVPFRERGPDHLRQQPFGQVPCLADGPVSLFESGACVLYLAERSEALMPPDAQGRGAVISWLFAALNSVEAASLPWFIQRLAGDGTQTKGSSAIDGFLASRLAHMENVLATTPWLTGRFSVADIVMADVFRVIDRFGGLDGHPHCRRYLAQATDRPAFKKALADQHAHFAKADGQDTAGP